MSVEDMPHASAPPSVDATTPPGPRWLIPVLAMIAIVAGAIAVFAAVRLAEGEPEGPAILVAGRSEDAPELRGFRILPVRLAPDFTLTAQDGMPFSLSDARGKIVLLFFGFTHCPDICPTTLLTLGQGITQLGTAAEDVQVVLVTVDPERDTPTILGGYVEAFHEGAIGLTGEMAQIEAVADAYSVSFAKEWPEGADPETDPYSMAHSATVFVIDEDGQLREGFLSPTPDDVAHDLAMLLDAAKD